MFTGNALRSAFLIIVEGSMDFPIDMLRHDRAFCLSPIPHPDYPQQRSYRVVVGFGKVAADWNRWNSFGWHQVKAVIAPSMVLRLKERVNSWGGTCQRCADEARGYTMSIMDDKLICQKCEKEERGHHEYPLAFATWRAAFIRDNYGFVGIGWPRAQSQGTRA